MPEDQASCYPASLELTPQLFKATALDRASYVPSPQRSILSRCLLVVLPATAMDAARRPVITFAKGYLSITLSLSSIVIAEGRMSSIKDGEEMARAMVTRPILLCLGRIQLSCQSYIAVRTQSTHEFECHGRLSTQRG
jgi:hypothetical protein